VNYYQPRELTDADDKPTGRWHYTCKNDGRVWPVGNCATDCPGHDSPEGAREHQRQYEITRVRFGIEWGDYNPCQVCGTLTNGGATWGIGRLSHARLCPEHQTHEHVDPLVIVGDVISSA